MKAQSHTTAPEVVVIGAGVIGLSIGWRLAQRGLRTVVVEAAKPASGSSGVAAGMLAPVTEADFGEEELTALNLAGLERWPAFVAELEEVSGVDCGYRATGALTVAVDRDEEEILRRLHEHQRSLGLDAQWLAGRECRRLEPGLAPRVAGGIHAPHDRQVSPRALVRALDGAFGRAGGELRTGVRVEGVAPGSQGITVEPVEGDPVTAPTVVVAAGADSGTLAGVPEQARVPVRPVKGQILRLGARAPVTLPARRVVRTPEVYAVPRPDGRLVVGATVEERGFDTTVTAGGVLELLRRAYEALPGVVELELLEATAGLRPGTPDNGPIVGESKVPGLLWATGHWRNGVLLAPITADAVAQSIAGEDPPAELAPFGPRRFAATAHTAAVS